jgi:hypothetical protein
VQSASENLEFDVAAAIFAALNSETIAAVNAVVLRGLGEGGELVGGDFHAARGRAAVAHGDQLGERGLGVATLTMVNPAVAAHIISPSAYSQRRVVNAQML